MPARTLNSTEIAGSRNVQQQNATNTSNLGTNPQLNQVQQQVATPQGNVTVSYRAQATSAGIRYIPTGVSNNVTFTEPAASNVGGNATVSYSYVLSNGQLSAQPTGVSGVASEPVYGTVGNNNKTYLGTVNYVPSLNNGTVNLLYSSFNNTTVVYTYPEYIPSGFGGYLKIGVTVQGQSSYNSSTGQVSVNFNNAPPLNGLVYLSPQQGTVQLNGSTIPVSFNVNLKSLPNGVGGYNTTATNTLTSFNLNGTPSSSVSISNPSRSTTVFSLSSNGISPVTTYQAVSFTGASTTTPVIASYNYATGTYSLNSSNATLNVNGNSYTGNIAINNQGLVTFATTPQPVANPLPGLTSLSSYALSFGSIQIPKNVSIDTINSVTSNIQTTAKDTAAFLKLNFGNLNAAPSSSSPLTFTTANALNIGTVAGSYTSGQVIQALTINQNFAAYQSGAKTIINLSSSKDLLTQILINGPIFGGVSLSQSARFGQEASYFFVPQAFIETNSDTNQSSISYLSQFSASSLKLQTTPAPLFSFTTAKSFASSFISAPFVLGQTLVSPTSTATQKGISAAGSVLYGLGPVAGKAAFESLASFSGLPTAAASAVVKLPVIAGNPVIETISGKFAFQIVETAPKIIGAGIGGGSFYTSLSESQSIGATGIGLSSSNVGLTFAVGAGFTGGLQGFAEVSGLGVAFRVTPIYNQVLAPGELAGDAEALKASSFIPGVKAGFYNIEITTGKNNAYNLAGVFIGDQDLRTVSFVGPGKYPSVDSSNLAFPYTANQRLFETTAASESLSPDERASLIASNPKYFEELVKPNNANFAGLSPTAKAVYSQNLIKANADLKVITKASIVAQNQAYLYKPIVQSQVQVAKLNAQETEILYGEINKNPSLKGFGSATLKSEYPNVGYTPSDKDILKAYPRIAAKLQITQQSVFEFNTNLAEKFNSLAGYEKFNINAPTPTNKFGGTQLVVVRGYTSQLTGELIKPGEHVTDIHFPGEDQELGPYNFGMANPSFALRKSPFGPGEAQQGEVLLGQLNSVFTPTKTLTGDIVFSPSPERAKDVLKGLGQMIANEKQFGAGKITGVVQRSQSPELSGTVKYFIKTGQITQEQLDKFAGGSPQVTLPKASNLVVTSKSSVAGPSFASLISRSSSPSSASASSASRSFSSPSKSSGSSASASPSFSSSLSSLSKSSSSASTSFSGSLSPSTSSASSSPSSASGSASSKSLSYSFSASVGSLSITGIPIPGRLNHKKLQSEPGPLKFKPPKFKYAPDIYSLLYNVRAPRSQSALYKQIGVARPILFGPTKRKGKRR